MEQLLPSNNLGLDLIRVTEHAALAASHWIGSGDRNSAHMAAYQAMHDSLLEARLNGVIAIGEERRIEGYDVLCSGHIIGTSSQPDVDLAVDPIDGTTLLVKGLPGAISVMGVAPYGSLFSPLPARYMDKIVVDREAAPAMVPECIEAPVAWTLALIARVKDKPVHDLSVFVLARKRHQDLINEIRATGARIALVDEGDVVGALLAALSGTSVDVLLGVGGASQGVLTACAVKALDGAMLARISPQSVEERREVEEAGLDLRKIYSCDDLVRSEEIIFSATGITNNPLLDGVKMRGDYAELHSLLVRAETGTRRFIHAEYELAHIPHVARRSVNTPTSTAVPATAALS